MKDLAFAVSPGSHTLLAIKITKVPLFIFKLLFLATTVTILSDLCKTIPVFFLDFRQSTWENHMTDVKRKRNQLALVSRDTTNAMPRTSVDVRTSWMGFQAMELFLIVMCMACCVLSKQEVRFGGFLKFS